MTRYGGNILQRAKADDKPIITLEVNNRHRRDLQRRSRLALSMVATPSQARRVERLLNKLFEESESSYDYNPDVKSA